MLDRLYTALGGKASAANDKPYADDAQLGDWARSSVYAMREIGIMQGKRITGSVRRIGIRRSRLL